MSQNRNRRNRKRSGFKDRFFSYDALEPRQLLATLTVTTTSDVADGGLDGEISLREAIIATNTNAPFGDAPAGDVNDDRIEFADSLFGQTITLNGSGFFVTEQLTIFAGGSGVVLDANSESRVFSIGSEQDVILRNLTITGGIDGIGGGIYMSGGGTLRLFESTISSNSAIIGAGVYLDGGSLVSNDSEFFANQSSSGGAIHGNGDAIRIFDSLFADNQALTTGGGGAITVETGDLLVSESAFVGNSARFFDPDGTARGGDGGAINILDRDNPEDGSFTFIISSTFDQNESGNGGAISNGVNNSFVSHGSIFTSNLASQTGSRFEPNFGDGGAIQNLGSLRLVDVSFTDNMGGKGGAVYSRNQTLFNRVDLKGNSAMMSGGAVEVRGNARFFDSTFGGDREEDGNSSNTTVLRNFGLGGALAVFSSESDVDNVIVVGGEFKNNNAGLEGGAIYVSENANLQIVGETQIIGNRVFRESSSLDARDQRGGAVSNFGSTLLASVEIRNNFSTHIAGGIYNGGGDLTMINSVISANRAQIRGGGMEIAGGTTLLFSTTIGGDSLAEGNFAGVFGDDPVQGPGTFDIVRISERGRGGGVFMSGTVDSGTRFQMRQGKVSNNVARITGGGLFNSVGNVIRFDNGVEVTDNRALLDAGGGVYNDGGHYEIRDAFFSGNAARQGAGIFNNLGSVNLIRTEVIDNTARLEAGGFYNRAIYQIAGSRIADNFAAEFPNFFNEPS